MWLANAPPASKSILEWGAEACSKIPFLGEGVLVSTHQVLCLFTGKGCRQNDVQLWCEGTPHSGRNPPGQVHG